MNARWMRHLFNLYPPYVGAGVRVAYISDDWRHVRVEMPLRWYNRNYVGTHFGGSLFAMTDPFLMIMAIRNLGPGYLVWDKAAQIEFVAPGRGTMTTEFRLDEADLDAMRARTADGSQNLPWFEVEVRAPDGSIVARVRKQLYVRRAKPRQNKGPRQVHDWNKRNSLIHEPSNCGGFRMPEGLILSRPAEC